MGRTDDALQPCPACGSERMRAAQHCGVGDLLGLWLSVRRGLGGSQVRIGKSPVGVEVCLACGVLRLRAQDLALLRGVAG